MTPLEFFRFLKDQALGEEKAVRATILEKRLGISDRALRELAEEACRAGWPVCSSNSGYYAPIGPDEVEVCAARLESQAKRMLERAAAIRRATGAVTTGELFGGIKIAIPENTT